MARAITVGVPVEIDHRLNRETGQANGLAVPEADRGVFKKKLALLKRRSIEAIPIDNSIEEEERKELEMRFQEPVLVHAWQILGLKQEKPPFSLSQEQQKSSNQPSGQQLNGHVEVEMSNLMSGPEKKLIDTSE